MEPVEINAGDLYLRQLRADDRLDDRPALLEAFADAEFRRFEPQLRIDSLADADDYIALRATDWAKDRRYSWAVAKPTTGALVAEVGLKDLDLDERTAETSIWVHPKARGRSVAVTSLSGALRFGFDALELREVYYVHAEANVASAAVARRCGFRFLEHFEDPDHPVGRGLRWSIGRPEPRS